MLTLLSGILPKAHRPGPADPTAGSRFGEYELVEHLGSGGMGDVWSARHRQIHRMVAIKLMRHKDDQSPEAKARMQDRFRLEAQATASLQSPHSVTLLDFGVTRDGIFYQIMELLQGRDLEALVKAFGPLPAGRVVNILLQICDSLDDAHRAGLVHRDVKPSNLFLCRRRRDADFVKLLDFGLVKHQHLPLESGRRDVALTREHETLGTPAFMAPEVASGDSEIDARADLYAVGCVAYWLLTGRMVFEEKNALAMAVAHATAPPPTPSTRTELPVPEELERIIISCLAKRPEDRPRSAADLAGALASLSVPAWGEEETDQWWTTHLPAVN